MKKKSKLMDCFHSASCKLSAWAEDNSEKLALLTLATAAAFGIATGVKACKTGKFTPLFAKEPAAEQTVDADEKTDANADAVELVK